MMTFQCFKIQSDEIESATENFGEHNVTAILDHRISVTGHMWTSIRIILDVTGGLNYLHNTGGKTWFSLNKDQEHGPFLMSPGIMVVILHL
nr:hypothetical protein [Tanacetum cinerariifolium]